MYRIDVKHIKLSFLLHLLQVVLNRVANLQDFPEIYKLRIKQKGNAFIEQLDSIIDSSFMENGEEENKQANALVEGINEKLEEAYIDFSDDYLIDSKVKACPACKSTDIVQNAVKSVNTTEVILKEDGECLECGCEIKIKL